MPGSLDSMSHRLSLGTKGYFRHCRLPFLKVASGPGSVKLVFAKAGPHSNNADGSIHTQVDPA